MSEPSSSLYVISGNPGGLVDCGSGPRSRQVIVHEIGVEKADFVDQGTLASPFEGSVVAEIDLSGR